MTGTKEDVRHIDLIQDVVLPEIIYILLAEGHARLQTEVIMAGGRRWEF